MEPLVEGGLYPHTKKGIDGRFRYERGDGTAPASFASSCPPDIHDNTIIIAAASPNVVEGHPSVDGWFLSDFYAFNYLLKGLGSRQIWLTAAEPRRLLWDGRNQDHLDQEHRKPSEYLHGNPYQDRKVVLNHAMLDRGDLTPVTVMPPEEMIGRFLREVKKATQEGKARNMPVLLLVFCHGLENLTFLLNTNDETAGLTVPELKQAIEPGSHVTIYSTACFSGGWVATRLSQNGNVDTSHEPLNVTMLAAAAGDDVSNTWTKSNSVGRYCGSIFASTMIETLASEMSPLLDNPSTGSDSKPLQPPNPSDVQIKTYNAFCQSILDTCQQITRHWMWQTFTFGAEGDMWADSWCGRTGVPLATFAERWNALNTAPYTGDEKSKLDLDPHPSNPSFGVEAGPSRTGGPANVVDKMTQSMVTNRVAAMAKLFLQTCPGDWEGGFGPKLRTTFERAARGIVYDLKYRYDARAIIAYRWDLGLFADDMVRRFNLPVPDGKMCIMWNEREWVQRNGRGSFGMVCNALTHAGFFLTPVPAQGPPFSRWSHYIAAAVVEANLPPDQRRDLLTKMISAMNEFKQFHRQVGHMGPVERIAEVHEVRRRGRDWVMAVGRKIRPFALTP